MHLLRTVILLSAVNLAGCANLYPFRTAARVDILPSDGCRAVIHFADPHKTPVTLALNNEAATWRPIFHVSPDGKWVLCIQKTGSGSNSAWLYHVRNGLATKSNEPLGVAAWRYSDAHSQLQSTGLYHKQISEEEWAADGTLRFTLRGSRISKPGEGVTLRLAYDPANGTITPQ